MPVRVAINGYGRIGRAVLRSVYERHLQNQIQIVAINDLGIPESIIYATHRDSVHGPCPVPVNACEGGMRVGTDVIRLLQEPKSWYLPWAELAIDVVLECSGRQNSRCGSQRHLDAGADRVLIGAPAGDDIDLTVVYGINHQAITPAHHIISNASCTTNCLATLLQPLHQAFGIEAGLLTTVHAYTNGQVLTDTVLQQHDLRRGRAATQSMIPTTTHATQTLGWVMPELAGKITGYAMRVPTINVSVVDLVLRLSRSATIARINEVMAHAAEISLPAVLSYNAEPLVSIDFNHHSASAIFDSTQTLQQGELFKVLAWYDNEWGYANRMLDVVLSMITSA
jgi:glyceraldehyde 3-phosphate dehydrogenase